MAINKQAIIDTVQPWGLALPLKPDSTEPVVVNNN
jgi:hypothetical protein